MLDEVITAIREIKQAVWSVSTPERHCAFDELRTFLVDKAAVVAEAEERIGGRDPSLLSPTGHRIRNLHVEAGGDKRAMVALLFDHLRAVVADVRIRAADIEGAAEVAVFIQLADGVDGRVAELETTE